MAIFRTEFTNQELCSRTKKHNDSVAKILTCYKFFGKPKIEPQVQRAFVKHRKTCGF